LAAEPVLESSDILKTLLDETRLKILGAVALGTGDPRKLATELRLGPREVSRHLSMMVHFGIVRKRSDGKGYELDVDSLHALKKQLFWKGASVPAEDEESSILNRFLDGHRVKQLPSKHKHRMVILRWLADKFDIDAKYPESSVNGVLKNHHPDCASLRRALVDHGFMDRKEGFYWRLQNPEPGA
jgi:hypothetical protein